MATAADTLQSKPAPPHWIPEFLQDELRLYPGRAGKIARITISCVLTYIVLETFRVPGIVFGVIAVFLVSRDTPADSIRTTIDSVLATIVGVSMVLVGAVVFVDSKFIHFFFLAAGFFLLFFLTRVLVNPVAAPNMAVGFYAASVIWDGATSPNPQVEQTLWVMLSLCTGLILACFVELLFVRQGAVEQVLKDIDDRLHSVGQVFLALSETPEVAYKRAAFHKIAALAIVGTGRLRKEMQVITRNHSYSLTYYAELSAVIALTGRLVDITATLDAVTTHPTEKDRARLRALYDECERIRASLLRRESLQPSAFQFARDYSSAVPALPILERTVQLLPVAFQTPPAATPSDLSGLDAGQRKNRLFVNDAFTNPDHLRFALKGMLAAIICYIVYIAVDWPGISTAVISCFLTALSTIGASKQKQLNRLTGAFVGGVLGLASLIFVIPSIDSITGISLLIAAGTALSAWFSTASPRISYFGLQVALGFYLTLLQGFGPGTSLEPPRDRLVGVLLSIIVMGLVFDRLWPTSAATTMRREFADSLRNMARFAVLIAQEDSASAGPQIASLRETINTAFANTHTDADSIKFEFGPDRDANLALRQNILLWQSAGRTLYLLELTLGRHLLIHIQQHTLSPRLLEMIREFCQAVSDALLALADRVEGKPAADLPDLESALAHVEQELSVWFQVNVGQGASTRDSAILATTRQIVAMLRAGDSEIPRPATV